MTTTSPLRKLAATDNVTIADLNMVNPTEDAMTAAAANAAAAALTRGWEPNPSDQHGMDTEQAEVRISIVTGLAADPAPSVIALGHSAVAWLNANDHVNRHATAKLDESGFHMEFRPLTTEDSELTRTYAEANPELDAMTMVNACVVAMGVARGWQTPIEGDMGFMDGEQVADYLDQLDENPSEHGDELVAELAAHVVAWLIGYDYIAPGHIAFLDADGFHIVPEVGTETLDALKRSMYDSSQGWLDKELVDIAHRVSGVRDPHEDRPGHEAFQILVDKDEQTGGGVCYTPENGWLTFGPIDAETGEIPGDRYPMNHPSFAAAVTWMTMTLTREWIKPMDMYEIHNRLLELANGRGAGLDRLHAYMADIDGPFDDLPAEVLAVAEPIKAELRARRSPTTLTVPTDAVPDADDAADGRPALEAWVTKAEQEGFQVQGFGSYFPGCESEARENTCGGVAVDYRWYAIEVVNGTAVARDIELEALEEDIALWDQPQQ